MSCLPIAARAQPSWTPARHLPADMQGLGTILQSLPVGSPTALLCLQLVLERWRELAARCVEAWGTGVGACMGRSMAGLLSC